MLNHIVEFVVELGVIADDTVGIWEGGHLRTKGRGHEAGVGSRGRKLRGWPSLSCPTCSSSAPPMSPSMVNGEGKGGGQGPLPVCSSTTAYARRGRPRGAHQCPGKGRKGEERARRGTATSDQQQRFGLVVVGEAGKKDDGWHSLARGSSGHARLLTFLPAFRPTGPVLPDQEVGQDMRASNFLVSRHCFACLQPGPCFFRNLENILSNAASPIT